MLSSPLGWVAVLSSGLTFCSSTLKALKARWAKRGALLGTSTSSLQNFICPLATGELTPCYPGHHVPNSWLPKWCVQPLAQLLGQGSMALCGAAADAGISNSLVRRAEATARYCRAKGARGHQWQHCNWGDGGGRKGHCRRGKGSITDPHLINPCF